MNSDTFYSPPDMDQAAEAFGAACGHGALAAALGTTVGITVDRYFDGQGGWVNIPMMKAAMARAGRSCRRQPAIPSRGDGVALVQWLGRWMEPQVPPAARCAHRHWIAFREGLVWDVNRPRWMSPEEWHRWVPALYGPKVTGHQISSAYLLNTLKS